MVAEGTRQTFVPALVLLQHYTTSYFGEGHVKYMFCNLVLKGVFPKSRYYVIMSEQDHPTAVKSSLLGRENIFIRRKIV